MIKKQVDFPLLNEYDKIFDITPQTIFAYDGDIYTNYELTPDLLVHEETHLMQQEKYGLEEWVYNYFCVLKFRQKMEVEAYLAQLASIKDRNLRAKIRVESAKNLSSGLYGSIINYDEALQLLWKK